MLSSWLRWSIRSPNPYIRFQVTDVHEHTEKDASVKSHLKHIFLDSAIDLNFIADVAKRMGWSNAAAFIHSSVPTSSKMRKGRFGEVLTGAILVELFGYLIPVQKHQYAITANQSLPSTDLVAIKKTDNRISEICFLESKLRTNRDVGVAVAAYKQLKDDLFKRIPDMVKFIICRLYETQDPLYESFLDYLTDRDDTRVRREILRIGIVCEPESWNDESLDRLRDEIDNSTPQRINTDIVHISCLDNFIEEFFTSLGIDEIVDD